MYLSGKVIRKPVIIKLLTMSVVIQQSSVVLFIVWCLCYCHTAMSQEKVCSSFCSSLGILESNPGKSCDDIYQINKASRGVSTHYWIQTSTGVHQVYCDMELECGGHKGGWMRIADLDTSRGDDCPTGWTKITTPDNPPHPAIDVCRPSTDSAGCFPTSFTVNGSSYHKICGKVRGYQKGSTDAFALRTESNKGINGPYVDGVSITVGSNRKHVWTYAVGFNAQAISNCPCASTSAHDAQIFVQDNYYCEPGEDGFPLEAHFTNNPLWDGAGCNGANNNCCADIAMPWFIRKFPIAVQDDMEIRICNDGGFIDESVLVDTVQLYVQ